MIQTRQPIPKYTLLNPVSLLWTWHFKHGVYATNFPSPDSQMKTFYISIKFIVAFHVNMLQEQQQLQLPVYSINGKHEKIPSRTF